MTAPTGAPETELRCTHDPAAVCWLCSDQVSWWQAARAKAGLRDAPIGGTAVKAPEPQSRYRQLASKDAPRTPRPFVSRCIDCGVIKATRVGERCKNCTLRFSWREGRMGSRSPRKPSKPRYWLRAGPS